MKFFYSAIIIIITVPTACEFSGSYQANSGQVMNNQVDTSNSDNNSEINEKQYLIEAYTDHLFAIRFADTITKYAVATGIKMFVTNMKSDYTASLAELKAIADKKGIVVNPEITVDQLEKINEFRLEKKGTPDHFFTRLFVEELRHTTARYHTYLQDSYDPDITKWLKNATEMLYYHEQEIKKLEKNNYK